MPKDKCGKCGVPLDLEKKVIEVEIKEGDREKTVRCCDKACAMLVRHQADIDRIILTDRQANRTSFLSIFFG